MMFDVIAETTVWPPKCEEPPPPNLERLTAGFNTQMTTPGGVLSTLSQQKAICDSFPHPT